ncbi:MAG: hypothetical protein MAGBODY4_00748 [Candidatus Marinimicrobia bacterium]|nr:hypothetical protein [Candidatus Neomarinimicrobiota bacterium]
MDILYTKSSREYKGNNFPEGLYRLDGITEIGRQINQESDVTDLLEAGAAGFVRKPINFAELASLMYEALDYTSENNNAGG